MKSEFDYESKPFGVGKVRTSSWYIPALKLKYGLLSLRETKGKILEVGCGGGAMSRAIKHYRHDLVVTGCDISRKALRMAKIDSQGMKFYYGDVYSLSFKNNSFDAILAFDVIEHLDNPQKALRELHRVLKPGGILHFAIPYEGSFLNLEGLLSIFKWNAKEIYCGHVNKFAIGDAEKITEKQGFKLIKRSFSAHFINQIADAFFFSIIALRKKNFSYQLEGYVSVKKGLLRNVVMVLKNIFAIITYYESVLLFFLPGLTGHLTFIKTHKK